MLRAQTGDVSLEVAQWWETYQEENENTQRKMTQPQANDKAVNPKRKRTYRKKTKSAAVTISLDTHD